MKGPSYRDLDYAFGQQILTLRARIGLTQTALAARLGISRRAIADWEAGAKYPKSTHLQALIALTLEHNAFPQGQELEEIQALWKASHQKVLLDEAWLAAVLHAAEIPTPVSVSHVPSTTSAHVDWSNAPSVQAFYGRAWEMKLLRQWVIQERCQIMSILGMGGIGKSALAVNFMRQVADQFEVVIWRSLRNLPTCDTLLEDLLQVLTPYLSADIPTTQPERLDLLLAQMREHRLLLVLDNLESVLQEGANPGHMLPGYEGFGDFLRRSSQTTHQSCVLLTSREKANDLGPHEGTPSPVRSLRLSQLDMHACEQLLIEQGLAGSPTEHERLIEAYAGNPLALKIVTQTILDLFGGDMTPFLQQGETIFGGVRALLAEQFERLTSLEQSLLLWLAILRDPARIDDLLDVMVVPVPRARLMEALETLYRRALIERGQAPGSFTVQSVVLEFLTSWLIDEVSDEILHGHFQRLAQHGLELARSREYVRRTQHRLIVLPILTRLSISPLHTNDVEALLLERLDALRQIPESAQGYAPANLIALLYALRTHLRGLDLSGLTIREAELQGVEMQDTSLAGASIHATIFTDVFDVPMGIAISPDGARWAAGSGKGEVRIWEATGQTLSRMWQAHIGMIWSLAFSSDNKVLVTVGLDNLVKAWDVQSATLLWAGNQRGNAYCVAFAPDGHVFATSGGPGVILWDVDTGQQVQTLPHSKLVIPIAWSPDGTTIATGDSEGTIRLWDLTSDDPNASARVISGHDLQYNALAFSPDGLTLASGSWDGIVNLWDVDSGSLIETLPGRYERIYRLAWAPSGRLLAIASHTRQIRLWDAIERNYHGVLNGHTNAVMCVAFTPDGARLISAGERTLRIWDVESGGCIRILQGHTTTLFDVNWNPDGTKLISGGTEPQIMIYPIQDDPAEQPILQGHSGPIMGVDWSPDGQWVASCSWDSQLRLWNVTSGQCAQVLQDPEDPPTMFFRVGWSPDGRRLASTRYVSYHGVLVWEFSGTDLRSPRKFLSPQPAIIHRVAWSPDSRQLAGGSEDGDVYLWDVTSAQVQHHFTGHRGAVKTLTWSPDGTHLATGGRGDDSGEIRLWDVQRRKYVGSLRGHPEMVCSLAWGIGENVLISGGAEGTLCWWDIQRGECWLVQEAHQGVALALRRSPNGDTLISGGADGTIMLWDLTSGDHLRTLRRDRPYERMNITGIRGLTDAQKQTLYALGAIDV
ncbi:MAG: helix-turn-helix domain-containing protein [Anaerolineae bacterium]|nr:helix-turn-helix domain-containing protein [Anaerolineae bacterium]